MTCIMYNIEDLQVAVDAFSYAYDALGLTLNARKTQVLFQPSPDHTLERKQPEITVGDTRLSSVDHFSYLGSCLSCKADLDVETQVRLKSASAAFCSLRDRVFDIRNLYTNTKIKVYKAVILPTLLYGSEAWTTYSRHLKSLERLPKKILYGELSNGRRNQGRQRKRFKDSLKHNLKQCGINPENWEQVANDRPSWRSAIHTDVAHSEQRRREHCESLRLARKERQQNASVVPTSTDFRCPVCQRICSSRIGLYRHHRTHVN
ncbi:hypothetical protein AWC38_SpisGene13625 [Stylophora pistillata]|uniref:C2H2-type domain-containing protein n=1 Tax=Stylophora pistillata TaxID=50429 RepID=A0A2B4RZB0_STYPI|nr:hypothetical protein AWC38_SpisGene13625 [Stylophora pistillata]